RSIRLAEPLESLRQVADCRNAEHQLGARTHGVCAEEQLAGRPRQCERLPVRCARVVEEDELRGHAFLPSSWTSRSGSCASARFMSGASARGATNVTPFACTTTRSRAPNTTTSPSS